MTRYLTLALGLVGMALLSTPVGAQSNQSVPSATEAPTVDPVNPPVVQPTPELHGRAGEGTGGQHGTDTASPGGTPGASTGTPGTMPPQGGTTGETDTAPQ
jgi:hypothetical protein